MMDSSKSALRVALALLLAFTSIVLAACGSGSTTVGSASTVASPVVTGQTTGRKLAPPEQQVLRVPISEPSSIDPLQYQDASQETVLQQLFAMLTRFDPNLKVVPGVAERWEFNAANTQLTFHLRETFWSDGEPVTAHDYVYGWRRFLDPRNGAPFASLLAGVIRGATELAETSADNATAVEHALADLGVHAVDERTLQVDFVGPTPYFPSITTMGVLAPVRHDLVEQHGERWIEAGTLIANGPFTLQSWSKGAEMALVANPRYYEGAPTLQTLVFKFITDDITAYANYQADEIDLGAVPSAEIPAARERYRDELYQSSMLATYYYLFDVTKPPFDDVRVRRAFAFAINRQAITDQLLGGVPTPAFSFIPPGMPGHLTLEKAGDGAQLYNPEQARQLLAEAGYPDGQGFPAISLVYANSSGESPIVQRVQADLQSILGIQLQLDPREPTTYFNEVRDNPPPFFSMGWFADFPDPANWDRLVFGPGSSQNFGHWENAEFARLLDAADRTSDVDQRIGLYEQAEQVLAADAGAAFIYWFGRIGLVKPWVSGLTMTAKDPTAGALHYKDVQILEH